MLVVARIVCLWRFWLRLKRHCDNMMAPLAHHPMPRPDTIAELISAAHSNDKGRISDASMDERVDADRVISCMERGLASSEHPLAEERSEVRQKIGGSGTMVVRRVGILGRLNYT